MPAQRTPPRARADTVQRTGTADNFNQLVYAAVQRVPAGRVSTYGHIGKMIDHPKHSRLVGQALKYLPPQLEDVVPWQRIINSKGIISARGSAIAVERQAVALRAEGVEVSDGGDGALEGGRVKLARYGWFEL